MPRVCQLPQNVGLPIDFTDPYFTNTLVFLTKQGSPINPDDPAQIDGHTVAAQRSTLSTQWMEKNHPKAKLSLHEGLDNAFMDLAARRSDIMISDKAPAAYWLTTPEGKGFEIKGKEIDVNDKMGILVRKGDPLRLEFKQSDCHVKIKWHV
ncbi:MAG: transporter substrate-binding domain-containing protein [Moraxella osloensis]